MPEPTDITFFAAPEDFRAWLKEHHGERDELWVGFWKKGTGKPSLTWPQSVAEALCFGWIDGIRKKIDEEAYTIRFTPRRPTSNWSAVNIKMVGELIEAGRMAPAGLKAWEARSEKRSEVYSYENRPETLSGEYAERFQANPTAWAYFQDQAPWYRKAATWWVVSAKKEETRLRRLDRLIADSAAGRTLPPLTRNS